MASVIKKKFEQKVKEQIDLKTMLQDVLPLKVEITLQFVTMKDQQGNPQSYFAILFKGVENGTPKKEEKRKPNKKT